MSKSSKSRKVLAQIILPNGTTHQAIVPRRFWASHLMQSLPYGTDVYGHKGMSIIRSA